MSHPFTTEYMQEGETSSNSMNGDIGRRIERQRGSVGHKRQTKSRQRTIMCESESVTEGCRHDQVEENLDGDMNISMKDKEGLSFLEVLKMAMRHRMEIFADEVSIVGLSYLVKPSSHNVGSIFRKVVWTMLLLFGTGFMVFQIYDRISYYHIYPTIVNYRVVYNRSLRFPTVTICSESVGSKKAFFSLGKEAQSFASLLLPPFLDIEFGGSNNLDLSKLNFDWDFFYGYVGARVKDMILECSFGNVPCNLNETVNALSSNADFCLSFNPVTTNYMTTQPGANYGLHLVMWVNQSDYFLLESPGVGFKVFLHDPRELPDTMELGFRVGTGISTSVSLSLRNVSMLPSPYGDCLDAENYTFTKCMGQCAGKLVVNICGCRMPMLDVAGTEGPPCPLDQLFGCASKTVQAFITSGEYLKCSCPIQCHLPTYPHSISTSPLSEHFLNYMSKRSQFYGRNLTMSKLNKELVFLDIFYSQMNYIDIQTTPAYDLLTLVCDVGGALGLILGGTLLTVVEFVQLFVQLSNEVFASARFAKMQRS